MAPVDRSLRDSPSGRAAVRRRSKHSAGSRLRGLSVIHHGHAVDEYMQHAFGDLVRPVEASPVTNCLKVKYHNVGPHALAQQAAIRWVESRCESANR